MVNFSLISNTCAGIQVYRAFNPSKNDAFIEFTSPFIGSLILEDVDFLRLAEQYSFYSSLIPEFVEPHPANWLRDTGKTRYKGAGGLNYLVMSLGGIEIHWIHEPASHQRLLLQKYQGRLDSGKDLQKIFLWSSSELINLHTEEERKELVGRFLRVDHNSIFLTEREEESFEDEHHISVFVPKWKGKSHKDRNAFFGTSWNDHLFLGRLFKDVIERKFL